MPLIQTTAGRYAATYAAANYGSVQDMGMTNDNGYELSWVVHQDEIRNTDAFGAALLQTLYRGADWRMRALFKEYAQSNMNASWNWGRLANNALSPVMGTIARLGTDIGHSIVLTSTPGTPAASNPASLTALSVVSLPNMTGTIQFTSKERTVPVELALLPYDINIGSPVWFTCT